LRVVVTASATALIGSASTGLNSRLISDILLKVYKYNFFKANDSSIYETCSGVVFYG
jgi:hypothetical protein